MTDPPRDARSALKEMDRRLRELQAELAALGEPAETRDPTRSPGSIAAGAPSPSPEPSRPTLAAEVEARAAAAVDAIRERLLAVHSELDELAGAVDSFQLSIRDALIEHEAEGAQVAEDRLFEGAAVVDAGPFADLPSLQEFTRRLEGIEGVAEVRLRELARDRAIIELTMATPVRLVAELAALLPGIEVDEVAGQRVSVELGRGP